MEIWKYPTTCLHSFWHFEYLIFFQDKVDSNLK